MRTEVRSDAELQACSRPIERLFVLFYASWCPYSRMFLPIFERFTKTHEGSCLRVQIDSEQELWEKYEIDVVPTVLFFCYGSVVARLDGVPGEGLTEVQLQEFAKSNVK